MPDEIYVKHYFGDSADRPELTDGQILYEEDTRALFVDQDNKRTRYNPPANWNETNTDDPSYIENKPSLGTVASHNIANAIDNSENIPTSGVVKSAIDSAKSEINTAIQTAETWKSGGNENDVLSKDSNGNLSWADISSALYWVKLEPNS